MTVDIAAIRARLAAATPGQWRIADSGWRDVEVLADGDLRIADVDCPRDCNDDDQRDANATLIAHAPADLAALCGEVEELREASEAIMARCDEACRAFPGSKHILDREVDVTVPSLVLRGLRAALRDEEGET